MASSVQNAKRDCCGVDATACEYYIIASTTFVLHYLADLSWKSTETNFYTLAWNALVNINWTIVQGGWKGACIWLYQRWSLLLPSSLFWTRSFRKGRLWRFTMTHKKKQNLKTSGLKCKKFEVHRYWSHTTINVLNILELKFRQFLLQIFFALNWIVYKSICKSNG